MSHSNSHKDYPRLSVDDFQADINDLWMKYGPIQLSREIPFSQFMETFAIHAERLRLSVDESHTRLERLRWAIASAEFSLGYMLLTKGFAKYPRGKDLLEYVGMPGDAGVDIGDMHFWHHAHLAVESIYRIWERIAGLLQFYCRLERLGKVYFDGVVDAIAKHPTLGEFKEVRELKAQVRHWTNLSAIRNGLSHESSYLFQWPEIEVEPADVLRADGTPHIKLRAKVPDLVPPIEEMKQRYHRCGIAVGESLEFIRAVSVERPDL